MRPCLLWTMVFLNALATSPQLPVFKSTVDLVRVDLLVVRAGRPVYGLTAADLEVFDSGVRQQIEEVKFEEVPVDVWLVLDNSRSVAGQRLTHLRLAAETFLDSLRTDDRAGIIAFSSQVRLVSDVTGNVSSLRRALDMLTASGSTRLLDALYTALLLPSRGYGRRLVLVFSDGRDNTSWLLPQDVLQVVRESDDVIYSIGVRSTRAQGVVPPDAGLLERLAAETGGRLLFADSGQDLREVFVQVVQEMKARYLVTYYPRYAPGASREGWHPLNIRLRAKKGDVIARRGYFVPNTRN